MTKAELVKRITVAAEGRLTRKQTERLVDAVFDRIRDAVLEDGKFAYPDFGTWSVLVRRERQAHNPRTQSAMRVPAQRTVTFRAAKALKAQTPSLKNARS